MDSRDLWTPSSWYLACVVHLLAGALIVFAANKRHYSLRWTLLLFWALAAIKEFVIDVSAVEGDSWLGSAIDFACYVFGSLCGRIGLCFFWLGVGLLVAAILTCVGIDVVGERVGIVWP